MTTITTVCSTCNKTISSTKVEAKLNASTINLYDTCEQCQAKLEEYREFQMAKLEEYREYRMSK